MAYALSANPDQTAPEGSGSTLFTILLSNFIKETKFRQKIYGISGHLPKYMYIATTPFL